MLVLTRRLNETIVINGDIEVTVVAIQGDRIRLGIKAPPAVRVDRQEVHARRNEFVAPASDAPQPILVPHNETHEPGESLVLHSPTGASK